MPVDLDGELGAETPARFEVVPGALEVFCPLPSPA
jgi:diacylglycerol kinase family enzyme